MMSRRPKLAAASFFIAVSMLPRGIAQEPVDPRRQPPRPTLTHLPFVCAMLGTREITGAPSLWWVVAADRKLPSARRVFALLAAARVAT